MQLITNEEFNQILLPVYMQDKNIYLNRKQIGEALEYSDPAKAIKKIHFNHKDRLDPLCVRIMETRRPQSGVGGVPVEEVYYSHRGILEICRWSRQPKANELMDWCWTIVEKYMMGEGQKSYDYSSWFYHMYPKYVEIENFYGLEHKDLLHQLFIEFQKRIGVDLNVLKQIFIGRTGATKCYTLDVIEFTPGFAEKFEALVDEVLNKIHTNSITGSATTIENIFLED